MIKQTSIDSRKKTKPHQCQKSKRLALKSGIHAHQNLTNDDEVRIPSLSSILLTGVL